LKKIFLAYAIYSGGAERLLYGMDSYGNICGQNNTKTESMTHKYNGLDMTTRPFVFYFDFIAEASELVASDLPNSYSLEGMVKTYFKNNFVSTFTTVN
jgi:hypothetical protein